MDIFRKRKYITVDKNIETDMPYVPEGICIKCPSCNEILYKKEISMFKVCPNCNNYFRLSAKERLKLICDKGTFLELDEDLQTGNPIDFPNYDKKIKLVSDNLKINEAVITGSCEINSNKTVICVMDSNFIMGSMGSVVGEKITRAFEFALENKLPIIIFTASGGARMQEGIFSLMQMAKVSGIVSQFDKEGLLYISVLTDPTTGGVMASFAMDGDIILAEPKALIGFAGPRVIAQTIKQKLPENFQTSEFLLENGFLDKIVKREELKQILGDILEVHNMQHKIPEGEI